ncbi:MAG: nucleotidyltransferase family protein [FCB group bacterium]|nr:nucleotidyltransferase family protein [FCB group bacterium]
MKIAAVVLAAGGSTRIPTGNKLLLSVSGQPMVRVVCETVKIGGCQPVIVVTGFDDPNIRRTLKTTKVVFAFNPNWRDGMSDSIRCGIKALPKGVDGVLIALGDMPFIGVSTVEKLKSVFEREGGDRIVFPVKDGRRGHPVLFPRRLFDGLANLDGDQGARKLLKQYERDTVPVPVTSGGIFIDCDTTEDYEKIVRQASLSALSLRQADLPDD